MDGDRDDYRGKFTEELDLRSGNPIGKHLPCTVELLRKMNDQMIKNKILMTKGHFDTAIESIDRGDNIVEFTVSENPHVLKSSGSGWAYKLGFGYHKGLALMIKPVKPGTNLKQYKKDGFND